MRNKHLLLRIILMLSNCMQALTVLEFLIKRGSDQCVMNAQNLISRLEDLQVFEYIAPDGRDHGVNVRHRYSACRLNQLCLQVYPKELCYTAANWLEGVTVCMCVMSPCDNWLRHAKHSSSERHWMRCSAYGCRAGREASLICKTRRITCADHVQAQLNSYALVLHEHWHCTQVPC